MFSSPGAVEDFLLRDQACADALQAEGAAPAARDPTIQDHRTQNKRAAGLQLQPGVYSGVYSRRFHTSWRSPPGAWHAHRSSSLISACRETLKR